MPRPHPPYPPEFRRRLVELVRSGRSPESLAKDFEPSAQTIRNWLKQADVDEGVREDGLTTEEREELRRLRRENRQLRITFELPISPSERLVNLYAGTLASTGIVAYDHALLTCHAAPEVAAPGMASLNAPLDAGRGHYYLVSASNCLGEGTRGTRSDGVERPALLSDCGPLP